MTFMRRYRFLTIAAVAASLVGCQHASDNQAAAGPPSAAPLAEQPRDERSSFYTVPTYDPRRDPAEDLAMTIQLAKTKQKRILLQVGGNWCGWCHVLEKTFRQNPRIASLLDRHFLVMKVNVEPINPNYAFLAQLPHVVSYPYLFVLDSDGTILHAQDPTAFEWGRGYSEQALLAFLSDWRSVDSEQ